jgi:hypothetical protein
MMILSANAEVVMARAKIATIFFIWIFPKKFIQSIKNSAVEDVHVTDGVP